MRLFPHFPFLFFRHLVSLIHLAMAAVTQGCYSVVMGFEATPLAVSKLVAMGSHNGSIAGSTVLTGAIPYRLE